MRNHNIEVELDKRLELYPGKQEDNPFKIDNMLIGSKTILHELKQFKTVKREAPCESLSSSRFSRN
ncbi:MAG: hypothetical protein QXL94_05695 [Candidatus Parvarchaeum sp.]